MEDQFVDRTERFAAWCENLGSRVEKFATAVGNQMVDGFHLVALFVIGGTIVWSTIYTYLGMVELGHADLEDILLLFIYLELGAMVGVQFKTHRLPVEFLLYVAITALTRLLVIELKAMPDERIFVISGAIIVVAVALLILQIGRAKFSIEEAP